MIDESSLGPAEMQRRLSTLRLTIPELELLEAHTVRATWSEDDYEDYDLNPYELLLCWIVGAQLRIPILGFENGEWPGGLRWDEIPGWKRAIWMGFRRGQMSGHGVPTGSDVEPS